MENCYTFKGQSLENGLSCVFQATGNVLVTQAIEYKVKQKRSNMESDLFFLIRKAVSCVCIYFQKSEVANAPGAEGDGVVGSEGDVFMGVAWDHVIKVPLAVMRILNFTLPETTLGF